MVLVCAGGCALALGQNARALAFLAFAGGFATPLLLSTGQGSHVLAEGRNGERIGAKLVR